MKLEIVGEITKASAAAFVARVEGCRDSQIEVLVDSGGGFLGGAMQMGEALRRHRGRTVATLLRADSAALVAAIGASRVVAAKDASGLVHHVTSHLPSSVGLPSAVLRAAADVADRAEAEVYFLLASKARPRELIIFSSAEMATHVQLAKNTLRRIEPLHAALYRDNPREHDAESSEREPCCQEAYMEAVARQQVASAEDSLRRAKETDAYWRRLAGKNEALTPERMLQEGLIDAISPASQSTLRAQHLDWPQAFADLVQQALAEATA